MDEFMRWFWNTLPVVGAAVLAAALSTWAQTAVLKSDVNWLRYELTHLNHRIDRTDAALSEWETRK